MSRFSQRLRRMTKRFHKKKRLIVMRTEDMVRIHPDTDWQWKCDTCGHGVGIYPSGQRVIEQYGRDNITICCNRCVPALGTVTAEPAPGALEEAAASRKENSS